MGVRSGTQTILITNNPIWPIYELSFAVGNFNAADFAVDTTCGTVLLAGEVCSVTATFAPSVLGWETAVLTFSYIANLSGRTRQTISLIGTGVPATVPSTGSLNLTSLFTGGPSAVQAITLNNLSGDAVNQGSFSLSGPNVSDFYVTTTCGTTFKAATACSVSVLFTPTSTHNESATLTFTDSDAATGVPYTQSIALTGTVTPAVPVGVVEIISKHSGKALEVLDASKADGAQVEQYDFLARAGQQWQLLPVESGYYKIENVNSGKVLDVVLASGENGAGIQQWSYLGTDNQKWQLTPMSDGSFQIVNKASGKLLDVTGVSVQNGATLQQWAGTGADNQKWMLTAQQYFTITSLNSSKVLDVTGYSLADGGLVQQWQSLGGANQLWQFVPLGNGYCEIVNKLSGKALEVVDAPGWHATDGTLVQQYAYSGRDNQQWQIVSAGSGSYTIANKIDGEVLDVIGISTTDGAGVQIYTYLGGSNQRWHLDPVLP